MNLQNEYVVIIFFIIFIHFSTVLILLLLLFWIKMFHALSFDCIKYLNL